MNISPINKTHKPTSKNTIKANTEMSKEKMSIPTKPYSRNIHIGIPAYTANISEQMDVDPPI